MRRKGPENDPNGLTGGQTVNGIIGFFAALYVFMTSSEIVFFSMLPGMIISGFVMTGILKLMLNADWITKAEVEEGIKAKEELERLENDPLYPKIDREYRSRCTLEKSRSKRGRGNGLRSASPNNNS